MYMYMYMLGVWYMVLATITHYIILLCSECTSYMYMEPYMHMLVHACRCGMHMWIREERFEFLT